ncbi:MAG: response regulator transcription factor [Deltaproteobacteria bacterium]|nr:response regulator transcription factor [Deltaproteobacteria bacterium]
MLRDVTSDSAVAATNTTSEKQGGRVLLVEDEAPIREGLCELFQSQGFEVIAIGDGLAALEQAAGGGFDVVVLDIMLPGMDGLGVLSHVRSRGDHTPVLLLTAKGAEDDIVKGLEAGADDYVAKPFGIHELLARVKGLMRRAQLREREPKKIIAVGEALIDLDQLVVRSPHGEVKLTARECSILEFLAARAHRPVGRDELLVEVWGYRDGTIQTRTVDVHMQQLRAKLKAVPGGDEWIGTVRGRGYRFEGPLAG